VGVHIGSPEGQYGKIWPPEKLAAVCAGLAESHRVGVVLVGGKDEAGLARRFAAAHPGPFVDAVGRLSLMETFAVIKRCALFVSSDTGMAKAAMAYGVPTATIWGPSDRPGWGVYWKPELHLEIRRDLPCMPCVRMGLRQEGSGVINFSNCGHRACLAELTPEDVLAALRGRYGDVLPRRG
jgi:ADP-heptose:LPS heptosyltransferase